MELNEKIVNEKLVEETEKFFKGLDQSMSFLVGKYFAIISKSGFGISSNEKTNKTFFGKIVDIEFRREYDSFNKKFFGKLTLSYISHITKVRCSKTIKFDSLSLFNKKLIYGDDEESVKLEMELTDV